MAESSVRFNTLIEGAHSDAYIETTSPVGNTLSTNFTLEWWAYITGGHRWNAGASWIYSTSGAEAGIYFTVGTMTTEFV